MENQNIELNANLKYSEACIKYQSKFSETIYHNVCTGEISSVPNGFWDYTIGVILILVIVLFFGMFTRMIVD